MWDQVLMTGIASAAAAALAVPAARSLMLGNVGQDWLAGELELDRIEPDGQTVRLKSGVFLRVFHLRGTAYDAKVQNQQEQMLKGRAALIHALGERGISIRFFGVKRQRDISFASDWPSRALREIGEAERLQFQSSYYIDWFLVLSVGGMRQLVEGCSKIFAILGDYRPRLLERPDSRFEPCPLTGFLNFLVCGDLRTDLLAVSDSVSANLPASDLTIAKDGRIEARTPVLKLLRVIAIRQWPDIVDGRLFAELMTLRGDIEISHIADPWDRDEALLLYKRKTIEQRTALIGNPALAAECEAVTQLLSEGNTTLFHAQLQIVVRAENETALNEITLAIGEILGRRRVIYSVETAGAAVCWFSRLPSRQKRARMPGASTLLRPLTLREQNIAALWTFSHSPVGMLRSPFGDRPVRFFRTPSGQAYAFQFHVSERPQSIGNYLVFAPTGGGKSTLMLHLLGGLAKFHGIRSYIFDSKEGARFMVEMLGGIYQSYDTLKLNPLDVGPDTPGNRHRVYSIFKAMTAGMEPGEDDDAGLSHAIDMAFTMEPPHRTLNEIFVESFARRTTLRKAFARWVVDDKGKVGLSAHVFNAPRDSLGTFLEASHMVGINMNEALDDPVLGPPVVAHISAAISRSAAGNSKGFCIFIDEAAKLLQNEGFRALAMEMYREYRKLNGSVGLAFQDPAALFRSGVAEAFLENTATLLFLPNSQASRASLEPFNLNEEQMAFILGGDNAERKQGERRALVVKRDASSGLDESAIIDVDLTPLGDALRFYRAGVDANRDLAELKKRWGAEWQDHI